MGRKRRDRDKRSDPPVARDGPQSQGRQTRGKGDRIPVVFKELLAESTPEDFSRDSGDGIPLKRRRTGAAWERTEAIGTSTPQEGLPSRTSSIWAKQSLDTSSILRDKVSPEGFAQVIIDDSTSDEDSNVEWEEVGINVEGTERYPDEQDNNPKSDLSIEIGATNTAHKGATSTRKKRDNYFQKSIRLHIHKIHLLCLLAHVYLRNSWCNDHEVKAALAPLLSPRTRSYLNPDSTLSQFQKARSFMDGLMQASNVWKTKFTVIFEGLQRPYWASDEQSLREFKLSSLSEPPMDRKDFQLAAARLQGSQDLGAQLFCALLRAAGVETRLVCSLQPLSFVGTGAAETLQPHKDPIPVDDASAPNCGQEEAQSLQPVRLLSAKTLHRTRGNRISKPRLILNAGHDSDTGGARFSAAEKEQLLSHHPVYWVEAFNSSHQKWIPVDPLGTMTVGKPSKLEPPFSNSGNKLTYAVAFESDGAGKDVTRRYAKAYNAKTRNHRVEISEGGEEWWRKTMRTFRRAYSLDRDQIEDAEFSKKEAEEGLPRNIQDFKNHPYYVLERHLKQNQIIHPKREVGKVNVGTATSSKLEPIYRRHDIHQVKSSEKWYRFGREIKAGEQPLKLKKRRVRTSAARNSLNTTPDDEEVENRGLYAVFQTQPYAPPPVVRGLIPRNAYGNIDVYVPSMIPAGAVHVRHADAARAARLIGVDYADAVTGFRFKGRRGTAVTEGIVIAIEFQEATMAVLEAFDAAKHEFNNDKMVKETLRMWKKFLVGLRIVEHVKQYGSEEDLNEKAVRGPSPNETFDENAGGFLLGDPQAGGALSIERGTYKTSFRRLWRDDEVLMDGDAGVSHSHGEIHQFFKRLKLPREFQRRVAHKICCKNEDNRTVLGCQGRLPTK